MTVSELFDLIRWDMRLNRGFAFEQLRAKALLIEIRLEQFVYQNTAKRNNPLANVLWAICRSLGSIYQWLFFNSIIPGSVEIGRGLRLPHPQNIIIAYRSRIGEFCVIYHNVSIVWNGFIKVIPGRPDIGDRVLVGNGVIIVGDVSIGSDVLIGAGAVVPKSIPDKSRVLCPSPRIDPRAPSENAAEGGSEQHMKDFYAIWR